MISRRQFLIGSAAGLLLPSVFRQIEKFVENHEEPLLERPRHVLTEIYAVDWGDGEFQLHIGNPYEEEMPEECFENWNLMSDFVRHESSSAQAFDYLQSIDLSMQSWGDRNHLIFYDGVCPGNDSKIVTCPDDLSLSLLQHQLNRVDGTIQIKLA